MPAATPSAQTEAALRHLAGVLLHTPSVRARELARQGDAQSFVDAASALFGLALDGEAQAADQTTGPNALDDQVRRILIEEEP